VTVLDRREQLVPYAVMRRDGDGIGNIVWLGLARNADDAWAKVSGGPIPNDWKERYRRDGYVAQPVMVTWE